MITTINSQSKIKAEIYALIEQFPSSYLPSLLGLLQQLLKFFPPISTNGVSLPEPATQTEAVEILNNNTNWVEFEQEMATIRSQANQLEEYEFVHS